ncbi:MAG: alkaline shock response membrane anchor protein AmaP [Candidatus Omnitrophica bacterium]|nr:alkaline shock response membrane anchor protein AmaP [Candidatus Omnitrophota bacterium]
MRLITKLAILFYGVMILTLACFLGLFVLHLISLADVIFLAETVYNDHQLRMIAGCGALLIFLINWFFIEAISGKEQREKNIAFDNPVGRVTVSLIAMEDMARRICLKFSEVKDVRAVRIKATKRGLDVRLNLALCSDVKIPMVTANLQEIIKHKIIETMWVKAQEPFVIGATTGGIEEKVTVRIDVTRIVGSDKRLSDSESTLKSVSNLQPTVPFQGYRA